MSLTTGVRRGLAGVIAATVAASGVIALASPSQAAPSSTTVTNAAISWGLSNEQGSGAFFGGCNFLSAGKAGNTGSSRLWTQADGFHQAVVGNVHVEKPDATGQYVAPTWADKCKDRNGVAVSAASTTSRTDNRIKIYAGTGTFDAATGAGSIQWTGSFTSAFYGGLTYWSATDPLLTVDEDGTGTLTATASGYGADMNDGSTWNTLATRTITLASFTDADITSSGFTGLPEYLGVAITTDENSTAQYTTGAAWGSFPQSFVDFQVETGQSSYWYSSGGARDVAKPATPVTLTFEAPPVVTPPVVDPPVVTPPAAAPVVKAATAKPTVKVSKRPTSKKAGKAVVTVKSSGSGSKPTGKVTVTLTKGTSRKTVSVTLKNGTATVKLPKLKKGTWKLKVTYAGSATQRASTSKTYSVKSAK